MQPHLSLIPAATLVASCREGPAYRTVHAFRAAAHALAGTDLAVMLEQDLHALEDRGFDPLRDDRERLRRRYAALDHPMAAEVVRWLDGADTVDDWVEQIPAEDYKKFHVLDVRDAAQFTKEHVPGAANIEWRQVFAQRAKLPRDKTILVHCNTSSFALQGQG